MSTTAEIYRRIAAAERKFRDVIDRAIAGIFVYTNTTSSSNIGDSDAVESSDDGVDPETLQKGQRPATRVLPYGFSSRQPKGLRGLGLRLGSSNLLFIGIAPTEKMGPQDLNIGDASVWSSGGSTVRVNADGSVHVADKGGATLVMDGSGNITATAAAGGTVTAQASGTGSVVLAADSVTGAVKLGSASAAVAPLGFGALDGMGMPCQQSPALVSGGGPGTTIIKME